MDCREARRLLSALHDDELSADVRASVASHVESCPRCGAELALFERLSEMAQGLDDPEPPEEIWAGIEAGLDAAGEAAPRGRAVTRQAPSVRRWGLALLASAAMLLVATSAVWLGVRTWRAPGPEAQMHAQMATAFGAYLDHFPSNPNLAQKVLLAQYHGRAVDLSQATAQLGYRPAVAAGLPKGYTVDALYVLKMPCCTCVQSVCRRDDGQVFAIFEHNKEQPAWFGDRPRIKTECRGCPCCVLQVQNRLVASWKARKRQLTVVGARDLEEIADLVGRLRGASPDA